MNSHSTEKREEALLAIALWKESGLSQGAFCKRESLNRSTFQHWRRRYDSSYEFRAKNSTTAKTSAQSFIALELKTTTEVISEELEIIYPNGVHLRCNSSIGDHRLSKLLSLQVS